MPELTPQIRTYIYRVGLTVIALAVGYNVIDSSKATLWIALLAALFSTGVASVFAPTKARQEAAVSATVEKIQSGEIQVDGLTPDLYDVHPDVEFVTVPEEHDAEHGVNPELIDEGDER